MLLRVVFAYTPFSAITLSITIHVWRKSIDSPVLANVWSDSQLPSQVTLDLSARLEARFGATGTAKMVFFPSVMND